MRVRWLWIAGAACFCAARPTDANVVVFEFTGEVTLFDNSDGLWNGHPFAGAMVGDSFALQYGFESTTDDTNGNVQVGSYPALVSMRVTVGSTQFDYDSFSFNVFFVFNDVGAGDLYQAEAHGTDAGNNFLNTFLQLTDTNGTTFSSDALPTSLMLSDFESRFAELSPGNNSAVAGGSPDFLRASINNFSIVPVPGAVVLALIGLPMAAWLRRRIS